MARSSLKSMFWKVSESQMVMSPVWSSLQSLHYSLAFGSLKLRSSLGCATWDWPVRWALNAKLTLRPGFRLDASMSQLEVILSSILLQSLLPAIT